MANTKRRARHRSTRHQGLATAHAVLAIAEEISAKNGPAEIKLADIADELGIETPAIYKHYKGIRGVIAALGRLALAAEISTFDGLEGLPFQKAFVLQAQRCFDLYVERPGLMRFLMLDLADPKGVHVFDDQSNRELVRELFALERAFLDQGLKERAIKPMDLTTFIAVRIGPALTALALRDLSQSATENGTIILRQEYLRNISALLVDPDAT